MAPAADAANLSGYGGQRFVTHKSLGSHSFFLRIVAGPSIARVSGPIFMETQPTDQPWWTARERRWRERSIIVGSVYASLGIMMIVLGIATPVGDGVWTAPSMSLVLGAIGLLQLAGGTTFAMGHRSSRALIWPISVLYLLAFPLGVLIGGYSLWVLYNTRESLDPPSKPVLVICCAGAVLAVLMGLTARYSDPEPPAFSERVIAAIEAQGGTLELSRWFATPGNKGDRPDAVISLIGRGLLRLSPEDQLSHMQFLSYVLDQASTPDCAAYARGNTTFAQQRTLTQRLDSLWVRQGVEVQARAILAEIRRSPPAVPSSEDEMAQYIALVYDSLSTSDRRRFDVANASISDVSEQDACWFSRLIIAGALGQPAPRTRWVRAATTLSLRVPR